MFNNIVDTVKSKSRLKDKRKLVTKNNRVKLAAIVGHHIFCFKRSLYTVLINQKFL